MQLKIYTTVLCLAACTGFAAETDPVRILSNAPLRFEPAAPSPTGVADRFIARDAHFRFEFAPDQAVLRSGNKNVRLSFVGAHRTARIEGADLLHSTTNVYRGNDPSQWRRAIPNYGRLRVDGLYPGIDLAYYGNGKELEYDLTVRPGANPRLVRLRLDGSEVHGDREGDLVASLIQKHPAAYQIAADGARHTIASSYRKNADGTYGFQLGAYDRTRALVIDPALVVAQYFAGSSENIAYQIGHDRNGLIYVGGTTQSIDLPLVGSSYQTTEGGDQDLFVAIVNPKLSGSAQVIYVTYFGGAGDETLGAMSISATGDIYLTGSTESSNLPLENASQTAIGGTGDEPNAFVVEFGSSQNLLYSTYFGGTGPDSGTAIAVQSNGWIWVAGNTQSNDLTVSTSFQGTLIGTQNMFIAAFDPSASGTATLHYSIYIGGTHFDEAFGIAVAPDGTIWLAGGTQSPDIWIQGSATEGQPYQGQYGGDEDAYIAHINPGLGTKALLYASFLGGSQADEATSLVLDPSGLIILSGYTLSDNFPVTSNAFQTKYGGDTDAFVTILNTVKRQLVYSTYFGGSGPDAAMDLKEDSSGVLYLAGYTESAGLPSTSDALQARYDDSIDAFGLKLDPSKAGAAGIDYFTYLGSDGTQVAYGVDVDASGNMYLAGYSSSNILSHVGGPARPTVTGNWDAFLIGFSPGSSTPADVAPSTSTGHHGLPHIPPHR